MSPYQGLLGLYQGPLGLVQGPLGLDFPRIESIMYLSYVPPHCNQYYFPKTAPPLPPNHSHHYHHHSLHIFIFLLVVAIIIINALPSSKLLLLIFFYFCFPAKSKKQRRLAAKAALRAERERPSEPQIPLQHQSIDLAFGGGTGEEEAAGRHARDELKKTMRQERRKAIKERNFLSGV